MLPCNHSHFNYMIGKFLNNKKSSGWSPRQNIRIVREFKSHYEEKQEANTKCCEETEIANNLIVKTERIQTCEGVWGIT